MTPLEHYAAVKDQLETRIDAIAVILSVARMAGLPTTDEEVTAALFNLGCDRVEIDLGIERGGL